MNNMAVTLNQGSKTYQESVTHKIAYNLGHNVKSSASADVYFNHDDEGHGIKSWIMNNIYI